MRGMIFDLDDTLVDTSALRAFREAKEWKKAVLQVEKTRLFDGMMEMLNECKAKNIAVGIVTSSVSFYADRILRHHSISPMCLVAYHDAPPKPRPDGILLALKRMSLCAEDVVAVGDSRGDCAAYRAAGVVAIGAGWSQTLESDVWDAVYMSPSELV